jgi:hypothetical protein
MKMCHMVRGLCRGAADTIGVRTALWVSSATIAVLELASEARRVGGVTSESLHVAGAASEALRPAQRW